MDFLPQFPLKLVAYPGEHLNLHIFEDRYKQLIGEVETQRLTFGIPAYIDGQVMPIGTEMRLIQVSKRHPNGELDIKTEGIGRYKIHEFMPEAPEKLYAGAEIERYYEKDETIDVLKKLEILEKLRELLETMNIEKEVPDTEDFQSFELAHKIGFTLEQEYKLLTMNEEEKRLDFVLNHLTNLIPTVKEMEGIRQKAAQNGHFKNVLPPDFKR